MKWIIVLVSFLFSIVGFTQMSPTSGVELGPNEPSCLNSLWHDTEAGLDGFEAVRIYENGEWVDLAYYDPISARYYRKPPINLLVEGQSNALGFTEVPPLANTQTGSQVQAFDGSSWGVAMIGTAPFRDTPPRADSYNFAFSTAMELAEECDVPVRILINSGNGWNIELFTQGAAHNNSSNLVNSSGASNVHVLWHQGEANNEDTNADYLNELNARLALLQAEPWFSGNFIVGELLQGGVNSNQNAVLSTYPNSVSSAGLTDIGDNLHFNSLSLETFGIRYANILSLLL